MLKETYKRLRKRPRIITRNAKETYKDTKETYKDTKRPRIMTRHTQETYKDTKETYKDTNRPRIITRHAKETYKDTYMRPGGVLQSLSLLSYVKRDLQALTKETKNTNETYKRDV